MHNQIYVMLYHVLAAHDINGIMQNNNFFFSVNGIIHNTGHGVVFKVDTGPHAPVVNVSNGPLSYSFRVAEIHLHFGRTDAQGSEHRVGSHAFPAELPNFTRRKDTKRKDDVGARRGLGGGDAIPT
ncbi:alpha-carbonic anhydrase domain-containing protein [Caerostris darwini]|uniref:Alpha-carbonic anhydrase domain-containing protein n=1 Tax=Caerostris darwini TaxID=1538125 RepID=A0AAV4UM18_9ARAC|nr:alpha-carbonic anhydrase domain-containing protein [Caerostris darwini]